LTGAGRGIEAGARRFRGPGGPVTNTTDHAEHTTLHGIGGKPCPKCEVPCKDLGGNLREVYEVRDYAIYQEKARQLESGKAGSTREYFRQVGVKIGRNVFTGLHGVNPSDLHKPDLLHNIYLGVFKHMMQSVEGFLKKHRQQQAFHDAWKEIPPYLGFSVPKKANREVTQWQGKEMRNLSRCILVVLASALRNPDSSQHHEFQIALKCVSALVDFSLMAQYRSHTPDTLSYLERYLLTFHQTTDIFLEFRTSKATRVEANLQDRELREQIANERAHEIRRTSAAKRRRQADQERVQRVNQRGDLKRLENHFNFIQMHYLSHFSYHVQRLGSISMYSTEIGKPAHKDQIKEGYRRSNKNEAASQIL